LRAKLVTPELSLYPPSHLDHRKTKPSRSEDSEEISAERIVTTLPSATEIVALLGLQDRLVGITHECDYPAEVRSKPVVMRSVFDSMKMTSRVIDDAVLGRVTRGESVYEIDEQLLKSLSPDLIITQELCEVCATPLSEVSKTIAKLEPQPRILSLTPHNLEEVFDDILRIGKATGTFEKARRAQSELQERVDRIKRKTYGPGVLKSRVFCMEWLDPIYCSGHWMPELVEFAGGTEVFGKLGEPSTVLEWDAVLKENPDVIFVTVCGYNVERTLSEISVLTSRPKWSELDAVKNEKVFVLDSPAYYSRSGPRLVDGLEIMAHLLHPELFPGYSTPEHAVYSLDESKFI
jgi:iron complex transport system substrate-binding protein